MATLIFFFSGGDYILCERTGIIRKLKMQQSSDHNTDAPPFEATNLSLDLLDD